MREKEVDTLVTKTKLTLGRTGKITLVTAVVLLLTIGMLVVVIQPTFAGKPTPQTWSLRLPSGYSSARQMFINMFPELTASKFHYYNPNIAGSTPSISLTINLESISAKATDYVFYENWHLKASGVDVSVGISIGVGDIRVARIVCKDLTADVNLRPPGDNGEFGTLTAKLKGDVLLSVPIIPNSPMPGYYYQGQELTIEFTLVEPRYTVTVTPDELSIPQGCNNGPTPTTVTVTPLEAGITGAVGLGFECKNMGGINGGIEGGGGTPPLTSLPLHINVQPWVPTGTYTANVVVNDYTTGKQYRDDITITVTESGYTITVDDQNSPVDLGSIPQGGKKDCKITITPWTTYSNGMPLNWNPTSGDFNGIGIGMPGGVSPPPCECQMTINVNPDVPTGSREMDIWVSDGTLGRQFTCHVTFEVVGP